ncbi:DNA cytosine methyltransferase [Paenibacillus polymyxa]|uniref:Uncharacterized protein n=1 Tax=Paenibacillus polymyxa (strain SC2) TaxID=886882 RepID=E3EKF5_PAEPS|nr:DNA cytosine methyltransferase [Paenibacillus polymyxa]ADO59482.1 hypothetical protein PPSC2_27670 [Paenibacillus polymyxa SC2]WPQ59680.1 DNA cytosine methyltransferase [Paenibacillus polymyxa]
MINIPVTDQKNTQQENYNVLVLCGGIGGSTLGYVSAGFTVVMSVDSSSKSNLVHWMNFPSIATVNKPIESMSEFDIVEIQSKIKDDIDILDVYLPRKQIKNKFDGKNTFLMNVLRFTYRLKPKIIVFHTEGKWNHGKNILFANELLALVKGIGYQVQMETLKASNYRIPQEKLWSFWIGVRKDIGIKPDFPEMCEKTVSTKQAIEDLLETTSDVKPSRFRLEITKKYFPPGCSLTDVKEVIRQYDLPLHSAYYKRDRWEEPYYRLPNSTTRPFHPQIDRLLSIQEAKRLQTFTDDYKCVDWKEICSSVPPLLIQQVAHCLQTKVLDYL